jgi:hypothetical protein
MSSAASNARIERQPRRASRSVSLALELCRAPVAPRIVTVARARSTRLRSSSRLALGPMRSGTALTCPPGTLNRPVASLRIAARGFPARAPEPLRATTALSVRTVIVPRQTLTPLGQRILTVKRPDLLTVTVVPTSVAVGEGCVGPARIGRTSGGGAGGEPGGAAIWKAVTVLPLATNSRPPAALGEAKWSIAALGSVSV